MNAFFKPEPDHQRQIGDAEGIKHDHAAGEACDEETDTLRQSRLAAIDEFFRERAGDESGSNPTDQEARGRRGEDGKAAASA